MTIKKTKSGWLVDIQPGGRGGKRYRKTLKTQAEAKGYEAWLTAKVAQAPEWVPAPKDSRRLSELIELWNGISIMECSCDIHVRIRHSNAFALR